MGLFRYFSQKYIFLFGPIMTNLLCLVHNYNSFQKAFVDNISIYYDNCYVIIRHRKIWDILNLFKISKQLGYNENQIDDLEGKPDNVKLFHANMYYIAFDLIYKHIGNYHYYMVKKIIEDNKLSFQCIHAHFAWTAGYVGMKLKNAYNVPFILSARGYDAYKLPFKSNTWKAKLIKVYNSADVINTISYRNYHALKKLQVKNSINILYNGLDTTKFYKLNNEKPTIKASLAISINAYVLLYVGNIIKSKGVHVLLEAFYMLTRNTNINFFLIYIGDGNYINRLKRRSNDLMINNQVAFYLRKRQSELVKWYNAADLFVFPSFNESFGNVVLESLGCGTPVVSTKNGGSNEIITNDKIGILVNPGSVYALYTGIAKAANLTWDSDILIKHASMFSWQKISKMTYEQFRHCSQ